MGNRLSKPLFVVSAAPRTTRRRTPPPRAAACSAARRSRAPGPADSAGGRAAGPVGLADEEGRREEALGLEHPDGHVVGQAADVPGLIGQPAPRRLGR